MAGRRARVAVLAAIAVAVSALAAGSVHASILSGSERLQSSTASTLRAKHLGGVHESMILSSEIVAYFERAGISRDMLVEYGARRIMWKGRHALLVPEDLVSVTEDSDGVEVGLEGAALGWCETAMAKLTGIYKCPKVKVPAFLWCRIVYVSADSSCAYFSSKIGGKYGGALAAMCIFLASVRPRCGDGSQASGRTTSAPDSSLRRYQRIRILE